MVSPPDIAGLIVALAGADVEFVVCGGVACVLPGVERVTMDLDLRRCRETLEAREASPVEGHQRLQ